jgi:HlyD family secretion protein
LVPNAALRFVPPGLGATVPGQPGMGPPGQAPGLFRIFAPPQSTTQSTTAPARQGGTQRVWVLDGGRPTPMDVKVGLTDGLNTEIVSGALKPGQKVLVGLERAVR